MCEVREYTMCFGYWEGIWCVSAATKVTFKLSVSILDSQLLSHLSTPHISHNTCNKIRPSPFFTASCFVHYANRGQKWDRPGNKISVQEYISLQFCYNMMYSMDFPIRYLIRSRIMQMFVIRTSARNPPNSPSTGGGNNQASFPGLQSQLTRWKAW